MEIIALLHCQSINILYGGRITLALDMAGAYSGSLKVTSGRNITGIRV